MKWQRSQREAKSWETKIPPHERKPMITCRTEGHEKVPATTTVPGDEGKDVPVCAVCEEKWHQARRARR